MNLIYKHENTLKIIATVISLVVWAGILIATKGFLLLYVLLFAIIYVFAQSGFISHLKGTGVKVSPEQYLDVYAHLTRGCQKLELDPVPDCYVLRMNTFNALATRFLGRSFVVLFAEVVDALQDHPDAISFYVGHELGHLKRRHLQWHAFLIPASILPLLGAGYRRAQEYTCDRHGLACSTDLVAAQQGLLAIATGGTRVATTNVAGYLAQVEATRSFWMSFHELIGDYPWLTKRVAEVTAAGNNQAAAHPRRSVLAWVLAAFIPRIGAVGGGASPLIGIAIIGVLAAIAIPAYQDYTIRAQVTEGLKLASVVKVGVVQAFSNTGVWPASLDEAGGDAAAPPSGQYVDSITVDNGTITIIYGNDANAVIADSSLSLKPLVSPDGAVIWVCGLHTPPADVAEAASGSSGPDQTTVDVSRYLPMSCRQE